jgi:predicted permease
MSGVSGIASLVFSDVLSAGASALRDLKLAARTLARQPAFALVTIGIVALGIAGATAIFSLLDGLFLRPLPLAQAERLVALDESAAQWKLDHIKITGQDFLDWRAQNHTFDGMAAIYGRGFNLSTGQQAERVEGHAVSYDLPRVLRLQPSLGRTFTADEDQPGGPHIVLLGHDLWQRLYGGRRDVLGTRVLLDAVPYTIVGVLPRDLTFPDRSALWVPLQLNPADSGSWFLKAAGRLNDGVSLDQARADLLRIHQGAAPGSRQGRDVTTPVVEPLRDRAVGDFRLSARLLSGAVLVVLLIACVNVAGLLLVRGMARSREMGVRAALGASRWRLARQLLAESLVLATLGGAAGVLLGSLLLRGLLAMMPDDVPRWMHFDVDARVAVFCLLLSAATAVLAGLWPALTTSRADVRGVLQGAAPRMTMSGGAGGRKRHLDALVIVEVALAAMLLVSAGLLLQAFRNVQRVDPGFRADGVLTYRVELPAREYATPERRAAFVRQLVEESRQLPGVTAAGGASATPLGPGSSNFLEVEGEPAKRFEDQDPILVRAVTPGYLETMGVTLRQGHLFGSPDDSPTSTSVIVSDTLAARKWPKGDALGKRLRVRGEPRWMTVIGVLRDLKDDGLDQPARPAVYFTHAQLPVGYLTMTLRTAPTQEPASLAAPSRALLRRLDGNLAMFQVLTMSDRLSESMWLRRAYSVLVAAFAAVALLLAIAGLAGVIWHSVAGRTREIGIRVALGAPRRRLLRQILTEGARLTLAGLLPGLAAGHVVARLLKSALFGVSPASPAIYLAVATLLLTLALIATLLPATQAASIDPMSALRND